MSRQRRRTNRPPAPRRRGTVRWWWWAIGVAVVGVAVVVAVAARPTADPVARDPEIVAAGEALFQASCAQCHGVDLTGTAQGPPFLNQIYAPNHHADEAFQRAVAFGVTPHHWSFGPMIPVAGLDRDQVASIVAFVRERQEAAGIFRDPTHP